MEDPIAKFAKELALRVAPDSEPIKAGIVLFEGAMELAQDLRDAGAIDGPQAANIAKASIDQAVKDLVKGGFIAKPVGDAIANGLEVFGPIIFTVAVDWGKRAVAAVKEFADDVAEDGCKAACAQNCSVL